MKLLTQAIRRKLPKLGATEDIPIEDKVAICKFFSLYNGWRWFCCEFDEEDTFFGLVEGFEDEWGYFSLSELEGVKWHGVPAVERDLYFEPTKMGELQKART